MDPLLQNDTRDTRVDLDREQSTIFLAFMYPDQLLLSKIGGKSVGPSTMEEVLDVFQKRQWYGSTSTKGRTRGGWLSKSGCPSLAPKSIKDREVQLAKFLNNVLGVVSEVCKVAFFRWDANSANSPLDGSHARRKPDIACYFGAPGTRHHHWGRVATFCEVKNRNNGSKQSQSFTEIAGKTSCILVTQDGRHLVPCVRLLGSCIFLTIFDRGGSITTHSFDIHHSPTDFLRILIGVSLANYSILGFDMSIEWDGKVAEPDDEKIALDDEENVPDDEQLEPDDEMAQSADDDSQLDDEEPDHGDEQPPTINVEGKRRKWLEIVNKEGRICKIWLEKILSISDSLVGRGSTVWEGVINSDVPGAEDVVAVKDSWIDPLRKYTEGMILHILEQNGVEGVPMLLAERQVKIQHHAGEAMETNLSTHLIRSRLHNIRSPDDFHLRVLSRLVIRPVGTLITDFSSLGELLVAFLDCIITHKDAVQLARILHRDISLANLLLATTKAKNRTTHEKYIQHYISDQAQMDLCKRISCLTRRGVLADWGYAIPITPTTVSADSPSTPSSEGDPPTLPTKVGPLASQMPIGAWVEAETPIDLVPVRQIDGVTMVSASQLTDEHDIVLLMGTDDPKKDLRHTVDSSPLYRTGTWSWMSAELVMAASGQPVTHSPLHDLESFFYVLVGICVLYSEPSKQKSEKELEECYDQLFNTFNPNVHKTCSIQSDVTWLPLVVKYISPYFQPLIPLLNDLRDTIIRPMHIDMEGKFHRRTLFDHDTIIRHFVMALSSLGAESWGLGESQDDSEIPEIGCDVAPSQTLSKQASNLPVPSPQPLLSTPPPFSTSERPHSDSDQSGDLADELLADDAEHVMVPKSLKRTRTEKHEGQLQFSRSPPFHDTLLASGQRGAWSGSRQPLMQPHDDDSDEYVPNCGKRARLSNQDPLQSGPSTSSALPNKRDQDNIPLRCSPRKKSAPKV